jgi:hypothetical protein
MRTGGDFVVVWTNDSYDGAGQSAPEIARIGDDKYVAVWESVGQDGDTVAVFGQLMTGGFPAGQCGNADGKGNITATDALLVLRTATGVSNCSACLCDVNGVGGVTASDALSVLRVSVGVPLEFHCPACG